MIKFLVWICCINALYAQTMFFKETRYISALDQTIIKKGSILFEQDRITTSYDKSSEILIYSPDSFVIKKEKEIQEIDLKQNPYIKYFFEILRGVYFNDTQSLQNYFNIEKRDNEVFLLPNEILRFYIQKVVFQKQKSLEYLVITLNNEDRIRIEQINP